MNMADRIISISDNGILLDIVRKRKNEQADFDKFILEQSKCPVEEAVARLRKLKVEVGSKAFVLLAKNSKAYLDTCDRYADYLIKELPERIEAWKKKDFEIGNNIEGL